MRNFNQNLTNKTHREALCYTKIVLPILLLMIFSLSFASASMEWDNVKSYDAQKKEVTIKNNFGFGSDIAKVQLNTPLVYHVIDRGPGIQQLVAEFTIESYEDYDNVFNEMEFFDVKSGMSSIGRQFTYKYKTVELVDKPHYVTTCTETKGKRICETEVVGTVKAEEATWHDLDSKKILMQGTTTVGIFTDVLPDDNVEWIPTLYGERVNEWAVWTAGLNTGLVAYYTMNESSGTNAEEVTNNQAELNATVFNQAGADWVTGKIGRAYDFDGLNEYMNSTNLINITGNRNRTMCAWINVSNDETAMGIVGSGVDTNDRGNVLAVQATGATNRLTFQGQNADLFAAVDSFNIYDDWVFTCSTYNETSIGLWQNGTLIAATSDTLDTFDSELIIGKSKIAVSWELNGSIDEVGVWNRTLTSTEISDLYNEGNGITYSFFSPPSITLNLPEDNMQTNNASINFNCSATDDTELINISLLVDDSIEATVSGAGGTFAEINETLILSPDNHNWTCRGVDNEDNIATAVARTFSNGFLENSRSYNNNTIVGASELFELNITKNPSVQVSKIQLFYNTTPQDSTISVNGDEINSSNTLVIPSFDEPVNVSFYWQLTFSDDSKFNTTSSNQSVTPIQIGNCSTLTTQIYNYTIFDEEEQTDLKNATIEVQLKLYDQARTTQLINFSQEFVNVHEVGICMNGTLLTTTNYSVDSVVKYFANETTGTNTTQNYAIEYYNILGGTISNATVPIHTKLYDLKIDDSTDFQLTFRDASSVLAPNILVNVYRQYVLDGDFKIVEVPLTDSNGQTILHLVRNDVVYNLIMVDANGNVVATFNKVIAFCTDYTIGQCTIRLDALAPDDALFDYEESLGISFTRPVYDNSTGLVSLSFVSNNLSSTLVSMEVLRNNDFGNRSVCTDSLTAPSGTLSCDVSAVSDKDRYLFVHVSVGGSLKFITTIDLEGESFNLGVANGAFLAFMLLLFLITMFADDRQTLVIALGLGWGIILAMGLIKGALIGALSGGIWLIICLVIFFWKIDQEESR